MLKLLFIVNLTLIIMCIFLTFKAFPKQKRKIIIILASSAFTVFMFLIIYPIFAPIGSMGCQALMETEANNVAAFLSDYFANPEHTKTPTINDLVHRGDYIPPEKRKSPRRTDSVKESDLMVFIKGEADDEIEIWVIAGKGQCPAGNGYVINWGGGEGEWHKSYDEN